MTDQPSSGNQWEPTDDSSGSTNDGLVGGGDDT